MNTCKTKSTMGVDRRIIDRERQTACVCVFVCERMRARCVMLCLSFCFYPCVCESVCLEAPVCAKRDINKPSTCLQVFICLLLCAFIPKPGVIEPASFLESKAVVLS